MRVFFRVLFPAVFLVCAGQALYGQDTTHIFPQVADGGFSDGTFYKSTLTVLPQNPSGSETACTFVLHGLTATAENGDNGDTFNFSVPAAGFAVFKTTGQQGIKTGYATLDCSNSVFANLLYTNYASNGVKLGEATVFSSPKDFSHRLIVDHRSGARLALAIANDTNNQHTYDIRFVTTTGATTTASVTIGPRSNSPRFLDELVSAPEGTMGVVTIQAKDFADFAVIGLQYTGGVFTTIPGS